MIGPKSLLGIYQISATTIFTIIVNNGAAKVGPSEKCVRSSASDLEGNRRACL